ncbi:putative glycosidase CRH2 [Coemansia sp. RSA 2336]|nr:putative glycosidase CRH2 [Coemansia sp. RSA 2336]
MKALSLVAGASLLAAHALGACTGMNAADKGTCPVETCVELDQGFGSPSILASAAELTPNSNASFVSEQQPNHASISSGNLVLSLVNTGSAYEGATVYYDKWIHYGTVTVVLRSGSTAEGIISSVQLQSEDGSSIDMDWVGASSNRVQANYYTNNQMELSSAAAPIMTTDPTSSFIEYKIVWLPDTLAWYANGLAVRTVSRRNTWAEGEQRYKYPDSPARLSFSIWDSGSSTNPALTQEWAGTMQTTKSEFSMAIKSVKVQCYSNSTLQATQTSSQSDLPSAAAQRETKPSESASKDDLSDFGLDTQGTNSIYSSPTSETAVENDVSKWLAGLTTSGGPRPLHISLLTVALAIAFSF